MSLLLQTTLYKVENPDFASVKNGILEPLK